MEREVGEGEEDRRRALPAGLGWSAQKREGREEGPRRAGRREGFLKPKINKLFLFTCGMGGGGRASSAASPPPRQLFVTARPPERPATLAPPLALRDPERARCTDSTRRGRPAPGSKQPMEGKEGAILGDGHYRGLEPGDTVGEGVQTPFPSFLPHPPPLPKRKAREPQRGDKRKDSTLRVRGGIGPFLLLALKPLAAHPSANPPTRPFKPFSSLLPSTPPGSLPGA